MRLLIERSDCTITETCNYPVVMTEEWDGLSSGFVLQFVNLTIEISKNDWGEKNLLEMVICVAVMQTLISWLTVALLLYVL